jgi:hypothetical protein
MALHKDLTGAELHEPKGVDTAASNRVYVADGSGSGVWTDRFDGHLTRNLYWLTEEIADVSTANSNTWFYIPTQSELIEVACITTAPLTTADATVSVYINGVLFADTLTLVQAGSVAGSLHRVNITTGNTIPAFSIVELRSDGASDTAAVGKVTIGLRAK